eukprot:2200022-Pleurochrysis_carterae.AAC.1
MTGICPANESEIVGIARNLQLRRRAVKNGRRLVGADDFGCGGHSLCLGLGVCHLRLWLLCCTCASKAAKGIYKSPTPP